MKINYCGINGRLTADVKVTQTQSGTTIANFSIAHWVSKDKTDFFDVKAFNETAEIVANTFKKGDMVVITEGSLSQERWTGEDGKQRSKFVIVAYSVKGVSNSALNQNDGAKREDAATDTLTETKNTDDLPF